MTMYTVHHDPEQTLESQFALDVLTGLSSKPKFLPSKYLYDDEGSKLFSQIMQVEDYYPTRCEREIFMTYKNELAKILPKDTFNFVELGAGDAKKTRILLRELLDQKRSFQYFPVDISEYAVSDLKDNLASEGYTMPVVGIVGDYDSSLNFIRSKFKGTNVVFFLGSTIGNFDRAHCLVFLRMLWKNLNDGDLVYIGFDLKKNIDTLLCAYNDREQVTRKFNMNMLTRINRELGGEFNLSDFQHFGTYNPLKGAMESYLISITNQSVYIRGLEKVFKFKAYEPVHLEYSYKFLEDDIKFLAEESGFKIEKNFFDEKRYFNGSLWRSVKVTP